MSEVLNIHTTETEEIAPCPEIVDQFLDSCFILYEGLKDQDFDHMLLSGRSGYYLKIIFDRIAERDPNPSRLEIRLLLSEKDLTGNQNKLQKFYIREKDTFLEQSIADIKKDEKIAFVDDHVFEELKSRNIQYKMEELGYENFDYIALVVNTQRKRVRSSRYVSDCPELLGFIRKLNQSIVWHPKFSLMRRNSENNIRTPEAYIYLQNALLMTLERI